MSQDYYNINIQFAHKEFCDRCGAPLNDYEAHNRIMYYDGHRTETYGKAEHYILDTYGPCLCEECYKKFKGFLTGPGKYKKESCLGEDV